MLFIKAPTIDEKIKILKITLYFDDKILLIIFNLRDNNISLIKRTIDIKPLKSNGNIVGIFILRKSKKL